jgi:hypothetical protein
VFRVLVLAEILKSIDLPWHGSISADIQGLHFLAVHMAENALLDCDLRDFVQALPRNFENSCSAAPATATLTLAGRRVRITRIAVSSTLRGTCTQWQGWTGRSTWICFFNRGEPLCRVPISPVPFPSRTLLLPIESHLISATQTLSVPHSRCELQPQELYTSGQSSRADASLHSTGLRLSNASLARYYQDAAVL